MSDLSGIAPAETDDEISVAYRTHYPLLAFLACRRFRVPEDDVRPLVHEVFVAFLRDRARIADVRGWLVGATCNRCRLYWRSRGREDVALRALAQLPSDLPRDLALRVDLVEAMRRLKPRCREVLRLRYVDALSSSDIAAHFSTTVDYARKLVHKCALAARRLLHDSRRAN